MGTNFSWVGSDGRIVHLGKRSAGWHFLFHGYDGSNHDSGITITSVTELAKRLRSRPQQLITDEYSKTYTMTEFLSLATNLGRCLPPSVATGDTLQKWLDDDRYCNVTDDGGFNYLHDDMGFDFCYLDFS